MLRVRISFCTLIAILLACSTTLAAPPEGKPVLVPMWKKTTVGLPKEDDLSADLYEARQRWLADQYTKIVQSLEERSRPTISPAVPIAVANKVFYYSDRGPVAVFLSETKTDGGLRKAGELSWVGGHDFGLIELLGDACQKMTKDWFKRHSIEALAGFFSHRTHATNLSVSLDRIYSVDELSILPPDDLVKAGYGFGTLENVFNRNQFVVWDLDSGKLVAKVPKWDNPAHRIYLSAPFIEHDLCFVLYEANQTLHVRCFSARIYADTFFANEPEREKTSRIWDANILPKGLAHSKEVHRRLHAAHLVRAADKLICQTNLGVVVALELATGTKKWHFAYTRPQKWRSTFAPEWVVVPPAVVGDKYIYAPADFPELLCLNVADGKKVWSVKKGDGLYPAVVGEQVLVIGEKTLRSLSLKDGSEQWKLDLPGLPCGRGTMLGDKYLLPFSELKTWKGMIAIVDLKAGKILEVLKPEKDEPIGNLVVHQEFLISQTLTEIAVFPIRK